MSDTQLTQQQRYRIYALGKGNHGQREIADIIGCHPGTISRELRRNRGMKGYRPRQAHGLAIARRQDKARPRINGSVWRQVQALLGQEWSPEQVSGRLKMELRCAHQP